MSGPHSLAVRCAALLFATSTICSVSQLRADTAAATSSTPSLKDSYKGDFLVGVALGGFLPKDYNEHELAVIKSQFNAVTPENCMKPESVHPAEDTWTFDMA